MEKSKMIIHIITHNELAQAYVKTLNDFVVNVDEIRYTGINERTNIDKVKNELIEKYRGNSHEVCFVTDLIIASSSNIAYQVAKTCNNSKIVTGLNLMLLIKLAQENELSEEITRIAQNEIKIIKG